MTVDLLLASGSPRRRELLTQVGVRFSVVAAPVDETPQTGEDAAAYVRRLAMAKSLAGADTARRMGSPAVPVLGADTSVVLDGQVLGKPAGREEAVAMLLALGGREHSVMTAVALSLDDRIDVRLSVTQVCFRPVTREEADAYWLTGEPADKAGGYGIQGLGAVFVESLRGSYSGVVGLPIYETTDLLKLYKVPVWQSV